MTARKAPAKKAAPRKRAAKPKAATVPDVTITDDMLTRAADLAVRGRKWSQIAAELNLDRREVIREMSTGRGAALIREARTELEASADMLHVSLKSAALTVLGQGLQANRSIGITDDGQPILIPDWQSRLTAARTIISTPAIEVTQNFLVGVGSEQDDDLQLLAAKADAYIKSLTAPLELGGGDGDQDDDGDIIDAEVVTGTDS